MWVKTVRKRAGSHVYFMHTVHCDILHFFSGILNSTVAWVLKCTGSVTKPGESSRPEPWNGLHKKVWSHYIKDGNNTGNVQIIHRRSALHTTICIMYPDIDLIWILDVHRVKVWLMLMTALDVHSCTVISLQMHTSFCTVICLVGVVR